MCRRTQSSKGLTLPAPDPEHALQQFLQGPFQGHVGSKLRGALGGRAIAHHRVVEAAAQPRRSISKRIHEPDRPGRVSGEQAEKRRRRNTSGFRLYTERKVDATRGNVGVPKLNTPKRMPSADSRNATRRPDPLTASQKLLLPLATLRLPAPLANPRQSSEPRGTPLGFGFCRDIRTPRIAFSNRESVYQPPN